MKKEYTFSDRLMGSTLDVSIIDTSAEHAQEVYDALRQLGDEYEERFSRFRSTSELSRLNTERSLVVSQEFMDVMKLARELFENTDGRFNPLFQVERTGYSTTFESLPDMQIIAAKPYDMDFEMIEIDETTNRITLQHDQRLDFGGFLKGHVAELMVKQAGDVSGIVVNIGGDIFTRGTDADGKPFIFEIERADGHIAAHITAADSAIATSGTYRRTWKTNGGARHHILSADGITNPETDLVSATVVAPHGYLADAYATVAIALGALRGASFLNEHGLAWSFINNDGTIMIKRP